MNEDRVVAGIGVPSSSRRDWGWLGLSEWQRRGLLAALLTLAVAVTGQNLWSVSFQLFFVTVRLPGALLIWGSALLGGALTFLLLAISATREDLRTERSRWRD